MNLSYFDASLRPSLVCVPTCQQFYTSTYSFVDAWWRLVTRPIFVLPTPKIQVLCIESKYVVWVLVLPQNSIVCISVSCYEISIQRAVALIGCISLHRCVSLWRNAKQSIGSQFLKTVKRISTQRSSTYFIYEIYTTVLLKAAVSGFKFKVYDPNIFIATNIQYFYSNKYMLFL